MRRSVIVALAGLLAIGATGSAGAATLDFTGTLSLNVIPQQWYLGPLTAHATASGSGTALVNGSVTGIHLSSFVLAGGTFGPITTSLLPVTASPTIASIRFTSIENQAASFTAISGGPPGGGPMGLVGLAKICFVFGPCNFINVTVPLSPTAGGAGFGIGGTYTAPGTIAHTYQHAPWTIGQPVMTIHTPNSTVTTPALPGGFAHGPASLTSSTAQPSGVVQLVTVTKVFTSMTGAFPEFPVTGVLSLHFVPEPGTLLLLCIGIAGLAAARRRRSVR